jgi:hypothetical protein
MWESDCKIKPKLSHLVFEVLTDKSKPSEKMGSKATDLMGAKAADGD